jgi:hypothetical protein
MDYSVDLAALYPPKCGKVIHDSTLRMLRIAPPPLASMTGAALNPQPVIV